MSDKELQKLTQQRKDLTDDYLGSVMGLYAFAESACWDEINRCRKIGSQYSIPYKFSNGCNEQTPDSGIQISQDYGIVAEMKKHFNEESGNQFEQIKKYDADLTGWWTKDGKIKNHDLVLLCHTISSINAKDSYDDWIANGNSFTKNFSIVEFSYLDTGQKQNLFLRRMDNGKLSDEVHDDALRKGKVISPKIIEKVFSKYKFYDPEPPLFHTLLLIYNSILPILIRQEEFEEVTEKRKKTVETSAILIRDMLQEQFLPKNHYMTLPKLKWVIDALDFLVDIKLAAKLENKKYRITIQAPTRKDLYEYFIEKMISIKKSKDKIKNNANAQQELFDDVNK